MDDLFGASWPQLSRLCCCSQRADFSSQLQDANWTLLRKNEPKFWHRGRVRGRTFYSGPWFRGCTVPFTLCFWWTYSLWVFACKQKGQTGQRVLNRTRETRYKTFCSSYITLRLSKRSPLYEGIGGSKRTWRTIMVSFKFYQITADVSYLSEIWNPTLHS